MTRARSARERSKDIVLRALLDTHPLPWRVRPISGLLEIVAHGGNVVGTWGTDDIAAADEIVAEANKLKGEF